MAIRNPEPATRTVDVSEASRHLSPLVKEVAKDGVPIIVEEMGTPLAAIVPLRDLERLVQSARRREAAFSIIDEMREAFADVPAEEIEREVAKAVAEVRAEMEAERVASRSTE